MLNEGYSQVLFVSLSWLISCIYYSKKKTCYSVSWVSGFALWAILSSFCVFYAFAYDYYSYKRRFEEFLFGYEQDYLEEFYIYLMGISHESYLIWRLLVWGGACLFIVLTCRKLRISSFYFGAIFLSLPLVQAFYYLRNSLAFALFFWGISYLYITGKKKILSYIVGVCGVICSLFLHQSMPFYLLVALFCFVLPFNKKVIRFSLYLFPFFYVFLNYFVSSFLDLDFFNDTKMQERGLSHVESSYSQHLTIFGYLQMIILRFPVLLCLYYSIKNIYIHKMKVHPGIEFLLKFSYVMIYVSLLFIGQGMSEHISLRFWNAALLPFSFFVSSYTFDIQGKRLPRLFYYLIVLSTIYVLSYNIYSYFK